MSSDPVQAQLNDAFSAIEQDELEQAQKICTQLESSVGEQDSRVLHLKGMCAWASGDVDTAATALLAAVDEGPEDPQIYLDCAELYLGMGLEIDAAEASLRGLLAREGLDAGVQTEAGILLAQCRLEHSDSDPTEALEILDGLSADAQNSAMARSTRSAALVELGRGDEAIALLESAEVGDDEAGDLVYQLGICYSLSGRTDEANAAMVEVRNLDAAQDEYEELDAQESAGLRSIVEELLEDLPEPLLKRVAAAPVKVQTRATDAQIKGGIDPRAFIGFDGDAETEAMTALVVMRNPLLDALDHESQLPEALVEAMIDEFRRFFGLEDLSVATT